LYGEYSFPESILVAETQKDNQQLNQIPVKSKFCMEKTVNNKKNKKCGTKFFAASLCRDAADLSAAEMHQRCSRDAADLSNRCKAYLPAPPPPGLSIENRKAV
jgi:hypothetical protein